MVENGNRREIIEGGQVEGLVEYGVSGSGKWLMGGMEDCLVYIQCV